MNGSLHSYILADMKTFRNQKNRVTLNLTALLAVVLASSCNREEQLVPEASIVVTLDAKSALPASREVIMDENPALLGAMAVYPVNEEEVIVQLMTGEDCLRWIHLPTGVSKSIIRRGRGPSELLDAGICGKWIQNNGNVILAAYSISNPSVVTINLTKVLHDNSEGFDSVVSLPTGTLYALADRQGSWCYTFSEKNSLVWQHVNWQGDVTNIYYPFGESELPGWQENYFVATAISIPGDKIIMAMNSFPRMLILDPMDNRKSIEASYSREKDSYFLSKIREEKTTGQDYYLWAVVSDKYIYALCLDSQKEDTSSQPGESLHIYTFDGLLKSVFSLEDMLINFFVSKDEKTITGINLDSQLIRYHLY